MKSRKDRLESDHAISIKTMENMNKIYNKFITTIYSNIPLISKNIIKQLKLNISEKGEQTLRKLIKYEIDLHIHEKLSQQFNAVEFITYITNIVINLIYEHKVLNLYTENLPKYKKEGISQTSDQVFIDNVSKAKVVQYTILPTIGIE